MAQKIKQATMGRCLISGYEQDLWVFINKKNVAVAIFSPWDFVENDGVKS